MYTNRSNGKQLPWPAAKNTHICERAGVFVCACAELQFAASLISQMKLQIKITELALHHAQTAWTLFFSAIEMT